MKNYPNQFSDFALIRGALSVIDAMNSSGLGDASSSLDLGYELIRRRVIRFRDLPAGASGAALEARIRLEQARPAGDQGPQTTARELRRTLRNMGWLDGRAELTSQGTDLLATSAGGYDEQSVLVEGLLEIAVTDASGTHHPVRTLLRLLAIHSSAQRDGLELALEPKDDSDAEFARAASFYDLPREERILAIGINSTKRNNAVKIFPRLAVTAGLVIEDDGIYSLSQDGWAVLGQAPASAKDVIARRRGRRATVGRVVRVGEAGKTRLRRPPRALSPEEQALAAAKLSERTEAHQATVRQLSAALGDTTGVQFEDAFSYDLLWVPNATADFVLLFEVKSIVPGVDAYARIRDAVGQLAYYEHFNVAPTVGARAIRKILVINGEVPADLIEFVTRQNIGLISLPPGEPATALNQFGQRALDQLP